MEQSIEFKEEYLFEFFSEIKYWDKILLCSAPMVLIFNSISTNIMQLSCFAFDLQSSELSKNSKVNLCGNELKVQSTIIFVDKCMLKRLKVQSTGILY